MSHHLNRQRSATTLLPNTNSNELNANTNRARFHSVSSDIVPQKLYIPEDDSPMLKSVRSPTNNVPNISNVGFQSIFEGGGQRRSKQSLLSFDENDNHLKHTASLRSNPSSLSFDNDDIMKFGDATSMKSVFTSSSSLKNRRASNIFSRSKDMSTSNDATKKLNNISRKQSDASVAQSYKSTKSGTLSKVARKIFHRKQNRHDGEVAVEQVVPSSLSKFLHPSYLIHRNQSQFIHNSNTLADSGRSVYSFNPTLTTNHLENMALMNNEVNNSSTNSTMMLHDLLKNLPSLEANYKNFNIQELTILTGNVWGVFCNVIIELFKRKRLWQLPAKIEDFNKVLSFYAFLKTDSKVASPQVTFLNELEEFISSSLYVLENQIIFNYTNENTMNTLLKRLGVIWQVFYQQVYYDVMSVLLPLEESFRTHPDYWGYSTYSDSYEMISVDHILLKCFRDCIVLPYYQNFGNRDNGVSKSFQIYIYSEEEENGVTDQDKLILLQCFGILSTIQGNDESQKILEELLEGIRMSI
ncbi:hypothetical protein TPHA_0I02670 [Tetrapisispora phaffii CBS 4417]|uniref:Target of rapamycin complex 2 subunit BIT2 n=1 Tax=Tetrapisispora phaffii (strain ATCC 24235 / CBS 4417 / NBRC 1672 / NRRL Y-8282 / UCD 70-5) TaxID=1071381 RepID=G8BXZ0_TETPH|nr:hypothetical protein TPHA_0I02670 [Tetrapisispora phaffii CBS 4417]CCE64768.1 hypothetical protein TPHA_0I02670 [Tetrapisispora phaffii CBS 4417]